MKQIRDGKLIEDIINRGDGYFHWLQNKTDLSGPLSSMLADTEFVSVDKLDDILKDKAKEEVRQAYSEEVTDNEKDAETVYKSIRGNCCLFEVILCLAVSINEMFEDTSAYNGPEHFVNIMMKNAEFDVYDEEDLDTIGEDRVKKYWQKCIDRILNRTYEPNGKLGLFPLTETSEDQRKISLWKQMNNWVDQHTDEDGEWVD